MKKQILFAATALMLTAGVVAGTNESEAKAPKKIAINKKNFPDQVFRELVKSNYDKNKDKKLSKGEIKKAKKFGTSSTKNSIKIKKSKYGKYTKKYIKDIKNFKGIEKLTNLQKFVANETSVKTINLKKNKNLTYLEMQDGNLRKIDLNSNKKLKYVYLAYNKISSLKMNKCKKLLIVNIQGHMVKKVKINRNKATVVYGEDYYAPYAVTKVKENFSNLNKAGQMDGDGTFCVYEWAADHSNCLRKMVNGAAMASQPVALDGDMVAKTAYYLVKVNAQGKIEAELAVNDQLIPNMTGLQEKYSMELLAVQNNTAVLSILTAGNNGVVTVDLDKLTITKEAVCSFIPKTAEGDVIAGVEQDGFEFHDVVVSKLVSSGVQKAADGKTDVEKCLLSNGHVMSIPLRESYGMYGSAVQIYGQNIYVISGEGFFKAKLTAKKFTQLYGISNFDGMQESEVTFSLAMKNEKEIYLMSEKQDDDDKVTYQLQAGKIG